jgi:hypothetical protein
MLLAVIKNVEIWTLRRPATLRGFPPPLQLFNREEGAEIGSMRHTTLATARLRFLFVAAKIWRHAGRVGVSYSDHYQDQGLFHRLMDRVRGIAPGGDGFLPVLKTALT